MKKISFIIPGRNNKKYLEWAYKSIRSNLETQHEICFADDASTDGTWEWCQSIIKKDSNFKAIRNEGPDRVGHTILYDRLINEVATSDIVLIYHCDMYACPGIDEAILKHIKPGTIVSLTRIEPPLHPPGPEKLLLDCGIEPEQFDEKKLLKTVANLKLGLSNHPHMLSLKEKTTEGIFAPWAIYKSDFQAIGGHDPLFAPQSREDSDIFNRFLLAGYKFIQTWEGFVYHMTCRGSRFNPTLTTVGIPSKEWLIQNKKSERNFIRKWGSMVQHDQFMKPIVPHKYNISLHVKNIIPIQLLYEIEPFFNKIYIDLIDNFKSDKNIINTALEMVKVYIKQEQPNTKFNLKNKIFVRVNEVEPIEGNIILELDMKNIDEETLSIIPKLSDIITDSGEIGEFEIFKAKLIIKSMKTYENQLIKQTDYIYT